jgi:hypothetical protein
MTKSASKVQVHPRALYVGYFAMALTCMLVGGAGTAGASGPPSDATTSVPEILIGQAGALTPEPGCLVDWPFRFQVEAQTDEEQQYVPLIALCQSEDGTENVLINNSKAVWNFVDTNAGQFPVMHSSDETKSFRTTPISRLLTL